MAIKKALAIHPDVISYRYLLANSYEMLGIFDEAEKEYRYINTIESTNIDCLKRLALVLKQKRNYPEAIDMFEQVILQNPDNAEVYYLLGDTFEQAGKPERAIEALQRSIELNPSDVNSYNYLGQLYAKCLRYKDALEMFQKAVKIDPTDPFAYHNLGTVLLKLDQFDEAILAFEKSIDLQIDDVTVRRTLAHIYIKKALYKKALISLQKAVALSPDVLDVHYELGLLAVELEEWDTASKEFREVILIEKMKSEVSERLFQLLQDKALSTKSKLRLAEAMQAKKEAAKWTEKAQQWLLAIEKKDIALDPLKEFRELQLQK